MRKLLSLLNLMCAIILSAVLALSRLLAVDAQLNCNGTRTNIIGGVDEPTTLFITTTGLLALIFCILLIVLLLVNSIILWKSPPLK